MTQQSQGSAIVNRMMKDDAFSRWLGIEVIESGPGLSVLRMKVRAEMMNGFGVGHGGITFSLADSALAFASNAHGRLSLALEVSISFPTPVHEGDTLTAHAEELSLTNRTGLYLITVTNQHEEKVAVFKGTVYRTSKEWEV
ncbi:MAG: hydroxyphenylacetyl-CoA thioesterase PaaI [Flavobacteriales bacterium]|nr:hydroxyphenylacetyl-CoA thioesterase PaaI [Flavobacteriales bacterium]MCB9449286.1 hydroxyphenylacetyl-CoA thioesterase PaaI [Flavobacteriales bacterium]